MKTIKIVYPFARGLLVTLTYGLLLLPISLVWLYCSWLLCLRNPGAGIKPL